MAFKAPPPPRIVSCLKYPGSDRVKDIKIKSQFLIFVQEFTLYAKISLFKKIFFSKLSLKKNTMPLTCVIPIMSKILISV